MKSIYGMQPKIQGNARKITFFFVQKKTNTNVHGHDQ